MGWGYRVSAGLRLGYELGSGGWGDVGKVKLRFGLRLDLRLDGVEVGVARSRTLHYETLRVFFVQAAHRHLV